MKRLGAHANLTRARGLVFTALLAGAFECFIMFRYIPDGFAPAPANDQPLIVQSHPRDRHGEEALSNGVPVGASWVYIRTTCSWGRPDAILSVEPGRK